MEVPRVQAPAVNPPLPSITHWPSLVTDTTYKTRNSTYPPGHANVGEIRIVQYQAYTLRPLGFFNSKEGLASETSKLLPWKAGSQIMGGSGSGGWRRFIQAGEDAMEEAMPQAAVEVAGTQDESGKELSYEDRWMLHWGRRSRFTGVGKDWETTIIRMGMAARQGIAIADSYCLTDKVDPSPEWLADPEMRKVTEWQGVYKAGERIWADDTVRVRKTRTSLPADVLPLPGPGSENLGVFLRVHSLRVQMLSQADLVTGVYEWLLKVSGDLYELYVDKSNASAAEDTLARGRIVNGLETGYTFPMISPPKGYAFRKINPEGVDAILDMTDIAGRVYPKLLQGPHFKDPANSRDPAPLYPDQSILSLAGLAPGTVNYSMPSHFDHGLYDIMGNQSGKVESHYIELYKKWLGSEPSKPASGAGQVAGVPTTKLISASEAAHEPGPGTLGKVLTNSK